MIDKQDERKILMDHYTKPTTFGFLDNLKAYQKRLKSESCSDEISIQIDSVDQTFKSIRFEGSACVIATSSSDLLFSLLSGKDFQESAIILEQYNKMITTGMISDDDKLEDLKIFKKIYQQKNRQKCALLGANGIVEYLKIS